MGTITTGKNLFCSFGTDPISGISYQPFSSVELTPNEIKFNVDDFRIMKDDFKIMKDKKEDKNMKILDLYLERSKEKIKNEYKDKIDEIESKDPINKIIEEAENQINVALDRDEDNEFILVGRSSILLTDETMRKIAELNLEESKEFAKLTETVDEVKAMLSMTDDYDNQIKILKNYDIIDKKTNKLKI